MSKEIEDLLKCYICKNNYDLNSHYPMIIKCGHTFCKECITLNENKENNNLCPIDNQQTIMKIESSINNLLIEEIIKKVFNYEDKVQMKQIIYIKPDIRRNRSPSLKRGKNKLEENNNENNENIDKSNENNYNINTIKSTKVRSSTGYKKNMRFSKKEPNRFSNINMKKVEIEDEDEKIKDDMNDSIETIPLNEDKSVLNISFKDEWTAFLEKNIIEKKMSKDEKEFLNNNNIEDTIDKISKIDDDFLTSSIANLIPALTSINNNKNNNNNNNNNKNDNNDNNNNNNNNNNNKNNYNINNILNKNNRHINNNNALKMAAIENIKKMSKNINIDANILRYASSTYNSKNKIALFNKANIERKTNNNSKEKNNPIITKDISKTPTKEILNEDHEDENKNNVLLQTYNKLSNQPYHKTVITNKHLQNKGNSSKNDDSRKETDESNKNNKSLGYELENKIKNKIIDEEQKKQDNNYNINIIDENKKEIKINEIPIDMNKRNIEYKNQNLNKSYTEQEENKYIKISKKDNPNDILIRRKNSDITGELKKNSIEKETIEKPKENKNSDSKNQNSKNLEVENKITPRTNIALQNFDSDISGILENSIIIMKTKNENTFPKLKKELISILTLQNNTLSQKEIEESAKYKKYINYIEKSLSNQKLKENPQLIRIKLFPNNDFFIGYIDHTKDEIKNGILYYNNGDYYEGEFQNGKKEGFGIIIYKNGTRYEGIFKNNKHNGYGKLIQLDGEVFIGDWKDGKINGKGVRYHSNGDRYIGSYINNIRNGEGHYIFSNGDSYEGNWSNGKANGKGKFTFKNGNIYEGDFKDNIICGKGKFTMSNGDVYSGVFKNGMINGKGIFKNSKGEKYTGFFLNGKKHGMGKLVDKDNNEIANGYWNMDNFVGKKNINEYM